MFEMNRRDLFKAAAGAAVATPVLATPVLATTVRSAEEPCHPPHDFIDIPEIRILKLEATRQMMMPQVETEQYRNEIKECPECGCTYFTTLEKVRGDWGVPQDGIQMHVPPDVQHPSQYIVVVTSGCRVWLDGEEIPWEEWGVHVQESNGYTYVKWRMK